MEDRGQAFSEITLLEMPVGHDEQVTMFLQQQFAQLEGEPVPPRGSAMALSVPNIFEK